jgi:hypothetical protein
MSLRKIINSWREASDDLNIKIQTPFVLATTDNRRIEFELLIEKFGNDKGAIILSTDNMTEFETAREYGYYCSALNPDTYAAYDRQHFIDTLNDWGYYGDKSQSPDWYTGQAWTE